MGTGGGTAFSVPRGARYDDINGVPDVAKLWRALDPGQAWNASNYNPQAPSNSVSPAALRTEELSCGISDSTNIGAFRARFFGWKVAEFSVAAARTAGYIVMRDPVDTTHVLLYDRNDPNARASKSTSKKLANSAVLV